MLIEFFLHPDTIYSGGLRKSHCTAGLRGKSPILYNNACPPNTHTDLLPCAPGWRNVEAREESRQTKPGEAGSQLRAAERRVLGGKFFFNSKYLSPMGISISVPKHGQHRREAVFFSVRHFQFKIKIWQMSQKTRRWVQRSRCRVYLQPRRPYPQPTPTLQASEFFWHPRVSV